MPFKLLYGIAMELSCSTKAKRQMQNDKSICHQDDHCGVHEAKSPLQRQQVATKLPWYHASQLGLVYELESVYGAGLFAGGNTSPTATNQGHTAQNRSVPRTSKDKQHIELQHTNKICSTGADPSANH